MGFRRIFRIDKGTMKRSLNTLDVFAVGYGDLGSSIYYALGITAFYALGATPIALMIAGFVFFLTALTYSEMSSVISESGGSASYTRKTFNDLISFFAGWALLLDYIVTISISAFAVGPYLTFCFPILQANNINIFFTIGIIGFLLILNIIGSKHSTRFNFFLTTVTILTQFLIIIFGLFTIVHFGEFFKSLAIGVKNSTFSPSWSQFLLGVSMAMVAYTGIESMAQLSAETRCPVKTVPRAMKYVTVVLISTYLGLSIVALSAMTPQELSTTYLQDPVSGIAGKLPVIGPWLKSWIGIIGGIILFSAANSGLLGASRVSFNLGENYQLPKFFHYVHPKLKTPIVSLSVFAVLASLVVIWSRGSLSFLADLYNFGAQLAFMSAHISLIYHRIKYPKMKRPFKIPFNLNIKGKEIPLSAVVGALANFSVWLLVVFTKKEGRELGFLWLLVGLIFYFFLRKSEKIGITESVEVKKVKVHKFEKLSVGKILVPLRKGYEEENMKIACDLAKSMNASITVLFVDEIHLGIPLQTTILKHSKSIENVFAKVEAIAKEYQLTVQIKEVASRSIAKTIIDLAQEGEYDLIIMGTEFKGTLKNPFSSISTEVARKAPCRVWFCRQEKI